MWVQVRYITAAERAQRWGAAALVCGCCALGCSDGSEPPGRSVAAADSRQQLVPPPVSATAVSLGKTSDLEPGQGVMISVIEPQPNAAKANLRQGDIILEVNQKPIGAPKDFYKAFVGQEGKKPLLLVKRGTRVHYTTFLVE